MMTSGQNVIYDEFQKRLKIASTTCQKVFSSILMVNKILRSALIAWFQKLNVMRKFLQFLVLSNLVFI